VRPLRKKRLIYFVFELLSREHLSSISFPPRPPRVLFTASNDLARKKSITQINPLTTEKRLNKRNKLATKKFLSLFLALPEKTKEEEITKAVKQLKLKRDF
jgi:hypothetical protein